MGMNGSYSTQHCVESSLRGILKVDEKLFRLHQCTHITYYVCERNRTGDHISGERSLLMISHKKAHLQLFLTVKS